MRPGIAWGALVALVVAGAWFALDGRRAARDGEARLAAARAAGAEAAASQDAARHAEGVAAFAAAARLAEEAGDARLAREYRAQSAVCLKLDGRPAEARPLLEAVLAEARAAGERRTVGLALGNLVRVEALLGRPAEALAYADELVSFAREEDDPLLEVRMLEQAAAAALQLGQPRGALERLARALQRDDRLEGADRRRAALLAQQANVRAALGDDEGAWAIWRASADSPASLANRARHLGLVGLHAEAAALALKAAAGFEDEGEGRLVERQVALVDSAAALIEAREFAAARGQLDALVDAATRPEAAAPFRALRAQLALREGRPDDAVAELQAVVPLAGLPDDVDEARLLLAAAHLLAGRPEEAREALARASDSLARATLQAWALARQPDPTEPASVLAAGFAPARWRDDERSLDRLRRALGDLLPPPSTLALDVALSDAGRLRAQELAAPSARLVASGVADALVWQALERRREVHALRTDDAALARLAEQAEALATGRVSSGQAVLAILPAPQGSYLIVARAGRPATTFTLPPAAALERQAAETVGALREDDVALVAGEAHALTSLLVPQAARNELQGVARWTILAPDLLLAVPPAMWLLDEPVPGAPPRWLGLDVVLTLAPHVAPRAPRASPEPGPWLTLAAPTIDTTRLPFVAGRWLDLYGLGVFSVHHAAPTGPGEVLDGAEASAAALRARLGGLAGLRLSVPAAGATRLGGLALAPSAAGDWQDEGAGFLPWHRFPELPLPPTLILDGSRFDARPEARGPGLAATALLERADEVLLARWPLPGLLRDGMVARIRAACASGVDLGEAVATAQRELLAASLSPDNPESAHPRLWAAWLPFRL